MATASTLLSSLMASMTERVSLILAEKEEALATVAAAEAHIQVCV